MVNWSSAVELARDSTIFNNLIHVLTGVYIWEFTISLDFEWKFVSRKRVFRWPLIFYFLGRYCLLFALIGLVITLEVKGDINCQALYIFAEIMGNASIGLASINLSLRTMAIWSQSKWVVIPLIAIILGHWSLLMQGVLLRAEWEPGVGCVITETKSRLLAITFVYTVILDFIVLSLTAWKLLYIVTGRSQLMKLIFNDGLIYFVIALLSNVLATTFMLLDLNPVMSIIFNVPSAIASTIVASRAVRRLMKFVYRGREGFVVEGTETGPNIAIHGASVSATAPTFRRGNTTLPGSGVHVQLDTFMHADDDTLSPSSYLSEYSRSGSRPGHLKSIDKDSGLAEIGEELEARQQFDDSISDISEGAVKHDGLAL